MLAEGEWPGRRRRRWPLTQARSGPSGFCMGGAYAARAVGEASALADGTRQCCLQ